VTSRSPPFCVSLASLPIPSKPTPLENQKHAHRGVFLVFGGFLPHPLQANTKNASTWTRFWCRPALHLSKTKSTPMGACFWFSPASLAFTSMPTTKRCPWGRVFGVGWLSSAQKPETHPHGCVSGIFWLSPTPRTLPPPQSDRFQSEPVGHSL